MRGQSRAVPLLATGAAEFPNWSNRATVAAATRRLLPVLGVSSTGPLTLILCLHCAERFAATLGQ